MIQRNSISLNSNQRKLELLIKRIELYLIFKQVLWDLQMKNSQCRKRKSLHGTVSKGVKEFDW